MRRALPLVVAVLVSLGGLVGISRTTAGAAPTPGSPIGAFDGVSARFNGDVVVSGWASDPDAPGQPLEVRIYAGHTYVTSFMTGDARPDVAAANPSAGPNTGWHGYVERAILFLAQSGLTVCARAVNVGTGLDTELGCQSTVLTGSTPDDAQGALEQVTIGPGLVHLKGWVGDPDGTETTSQIRIYYDWNLVAQMNASTPRPDVQAAHGFGSANGFDVTLPVLPGHHGFCVIGENGGLHGAVNPFLGCEQRTVPGVPRPGPHDPLGVVDSIQAPFRPTLVGWAFDPDSGAPVKVVARALQVPSSDLLPMRYVQRTTNLARPDVQAAFPGAPLSSGFGLDFTWDGSLPPHMWWYGGGPPGQWFACVYADNLGPGKNRLLGCGAFHR